MFQYFKVGHLLDMTFNAIRFSNVIGKLFNVFYRNICQSDSGSKELPLVCTFFYG